MARPLHLLALDPGLTTAWACYRLEGRRLTLVRYGCQRYPGNPKGSAGREQVYQWATALLAPFASADEVATDSELAGANLATNVPALGAFEAARAFGRDHGRRVERGRVYGEYARCSYIRTVGLFTGQEQPWKPGVPALRAALSELTGRDLADTTGERRHCLDAIAAGVHHAWKAHRWWPAGWQDPKIEERGREVEAWLKMGARGPRPAKQRWGEDIST